MRRSVGKGKRHSRDPTAIVGTVSREFWKELNARFKPDEPALQQAWRVARPYSPVDDIIKGLARPFESDQKRYLLYGTTGAGKTTELLRVGDARAKDTFVVFFDVGRHFDAVGDPAALDHLQPWEVVLLCGLAVVRAASELQGHDWDARELKALSKAAEALMGGGQSGSLDVVKLASSVLVLAGGAIGAAAGGPVGGAVGAAVLKTVGAAVEDASGLVNAAKWNISLGGRGRREFVRDQDARAKNLLAAVNNLIGTLQTTYGPVTFILDGLDRIKDPKTTEHVFIESRLLGALTCATVVTGSAGLVGRGLPRTSFDAYMLHSVPVMQQEALGDSTQPDESVECFVEAYNARTADLEGSSSRVSRTLLRRLGYFSGGRFRDFVRFVRDLAGECWDDDAEAATEEHVNKVLDRWRKMYEEGLDADRIALLRTARDTRELPGGDKGLELVTNLWLLPYPNGTKWWAPHPLLLMGTTLE